MIGMNTFQKEIISLSTARTELRLANMQKIEKNIYQQSDGGNTV